MNPLLDKHFIELLDKDNQREIYAKIISLTLDEYPVEEISGKVSQGTISIDGTSAVRRTCSLTIISDRVNINDYYWGFTNKFKLYIGLKVPDNIRNTYFEDTTMAMQDQYTSGVFVNGEVVKPYEAYPDIIWFPQGVFLITDFKYNLNANSTDNIYITGKDKMCLINGDIGGHFPHATDLKYREDYTYDTDGVTILDRVETELTIKEIITEMIHKYANEPLHNIIVNDLDQTGYQMLDYKGENDIFLFKNVNSGLFENVVFDGDITRYDMYNNPIIIKDMTDIQLDSLSSTYISKTALKIKNTNNILDQTYYTVVKCSYGAAVGYRVTDLTYPDDLIANPGETVTSILDKLVKMLNDYEYFYDLQGRFVFQKKLIYVSTSWNPIAETQQEAVASYTGYVRTERSNLVNGMDMRDSLAITELEDTTYVESMKLVSQVQYNFVDGLTSTAYANTPNISNMRNDYAIWGKQKKNSDGKDNMIHLRCAIDEKPEIYKAWDGTVYSVEDWDWRELIYQMALDYLEHNHDDDYEVVLYKNNPSFRYGRTGYEQYYEDIVGFWRYLYNPYPPSGTNFDKVLYNNLQEAIIGYEATYFTNTKDNTQYWRKDVFNNPGVLKFWFDFLDAPDSSLNKYSVKAIGDRTKVINENDIKAIYYGEIPTIIFITPEDYQELQDTRRVNDGYTYILLPPTMEDYFDVSTKSKTCQEKLDQLLYEHAYCNESITITTIPIYHLEPNTRINVYDAKSNINGEYIINKMTIPLGYNATMQIMATKAPIKLL